MEFEKTIFLGKIIEKNLCNKKILEKLKIKKTDATAYGPMHTIEVEREHLAELRTYMAPGPRCMFFWEVGGNRAKVLFKDKEFNIIVSDKSTWVEAIRYGRSIGIPELELDFKIERDESSN